MNNNDKCLVGNNTNKNNINKRNIDNINKDKNKSHALLSASSSHRWLNCPPSAKLQLNFEDVESEHAKQGSAAHSLGEYKLKKLLNIKCEKPTSDFNSKEMDIYTDDYVDFVMEQIDLEKQRSSDWVVLVEERLDFSHYVPEGFGTGDCVIVTNEKLHIIDFKYGKGIMVSATDNSQMKLYALGALKIYENLYDIKEVYMTIFQPRRENVDTWVLSVEDLKKWAGFKVVEGRSNRKYKDEKEVEKVAKSNGFKNI